MPKQPKEETHADVLVKIGLHAVPGAGHAAHLATAAQIDPGVASHVDDLQSGAEAGHDASGMGAASLSEGGGTVMQGPEDGGAFLNRPAGGFVAHSADMQSVDVLGDPDTGAVHALKSIDGYGHLHVMGHDVDAFDYLPGGDYVKLMAGQIPDPTELALMVGKTMAEKEAAGTIDLGLEKHHANNERGIAGNVSRGPAEDLGQRTPHGAAKAAGAASGAEATAEAAHAEGETRLEQTAEAGAAAPAGHGAPTRRGPGVADYDTQARDMGELMEDHNQRLSTALETSDEADIHTEKHVHGRTIEINTHYEAHEHDFQHERQEADGHVNAALQSLGTHETSTDKPGLSLRTLIAAHLDAKAHDEGMAI